MFALFFGAPMIFAIRGQFFLAAIAPFFIQFLPLIWQVVFTNSDAPGFGMLLLVTMPISVVLLVLGIVYLAIRLCGRRYNV
jgi:hypothetical protein